LPAVTNENPLRPAKLLKVKEGDLAERVGFVPSRDERARRAMPEDHPTAKAERSEELAERVGFGLFQLL
jgi:hypothetical protein